jgi:hypothetical protein
MKLPPQIANNVRKTNELVICENCSRILYWQDGLEKKEETAEPIPSEAAETQAVPTESMDGSKEDSVNHEITQDSHK